MIQCFLHPCNTIDTWKALEHEMPSFVVEDLSGKRWFVTLIDDHTRLTWIYLITDKYEVNSIFRQFYTNIETQFNAKIAILRSDNGREFVNQSFREFLDMKGIIQQSSCAYTPQQNGVAERKNRHLLKLLDLLCCPLPCHRTSRGMRSLQLLTLLIERLPKF